MRRKREGNFSVNAVGVPEVSQALEYLHLGPRQREDQVKITEFLLLEDYSQRRIGFETPLKRLKSIKMSINLL